MDTFDWRLLKVLHETHNITKTSQKQNGNIVVNENTQNTIIKTHTHISSNRKQIKRLSHFYLLILRIFLIIDCQYILSFNTRITVTV